MTVRLRANPGGEIAPDEVIGRDRLIARLWKVLETRSVVLSSERRVVKTSIVKKMRQQAPAGTVTFYHDFEDIYLPLDFVESVFRDVEAHLKLGHKVAEGAGRLLTRNGWKFIVWRRRIGAAIDAGQVLARTSLFQGDRSMLPR